MGYFILPPHSFNNDATASARGALITYFEAVAKTMGYEVEWVGPLPLPRLTDYLKKGDEIDGTVSFPKFPTFETFLYYPDTHVYLGQPILIVRMDNPLTEIRSIDDIRGYRIGLFKSASGRSTPLLDDHRDVIMMDELGGDMWIEQNMEKLVTGRLDALFDRQQYSMPFVAAKLKLDTRINVLSIPAPPTPMYIVFSKTSAKGKILLQRYNATIGQINLMYEELLKKSLRLSCNISKDICMLFLIFVSFLASD
jgi:ABC-type amino acid transport substrate-binding protein